MAIGPKYFVASRVLHWTLYIRQASTIRRLQSKYNHTTTTADRPRSGQPKILSRQQRKIIWRIARRSLKIDCASLPSKATLHRMLRSLNTVKYRCKKRPKPTPFYALCLSLLTMALGPPHSQVLR
ncbi:hypothetical protein GGP41_008490 [Bipolaris sorokiniana]|uniref:Transposase Tc1-like domain-containing protein n=1 Tax=Cochliobolus sativus TaxID=45130 RepID=A0A8H5ZB28_COCSA|nr:hypothetical protein GGP41_008490 [Bipolaris sorokiniana]